MSEKTEFADVEIRIQSRQDEGYPIELTVNHQQEFIGGHLSPDLLDWIPSVSPTVDGEKLFEQLMQDDRVKQAWAQIRGQAPKRRIRLRIDADAPELHAIPWELLRDGQATPPEAITADSRLPFSRYLAGQWEVLQPLEERPIKILALLANPRNLDDYKLQQIEIETEKEIIESAFLDFTMGQVEITYLEPPINLSTLEQALRNNNYHMLHIVSHGAYSQRRQEAVLYWADSNNRVKLVRDSAMADMLARLEQKPHLVFFSTCQSASRSPAEAFQGFAPLLINAGVPAVIAMQDLVPVKTARQFSRVFYQQLFRHGQVDLASNEARSAVMTEELSGGSIPVLFSRLTDNQLLGQADPNSLAVIEHEPYEPETILIPEGSFLMGHDPAEGIPDHETPQHELHLPSYRIGKYPVTNAQYAEFFKVKENRATKISKKWLDRAELEEHPVRGVSWFDAEAYCKWLTGVTGRPYRLPTEAEWEKAARGTEGLTYPWGNDWDSKNCNNASQHKRRKRTTLHFRTDSRRQQEEKKRGKKREEKEPSTTPVSLYETGQSPYGCFDMVGNVWEWTRSQGGEVRKNEFPYPYQIGDERENYDFSNTRLLRVLRGRSYEDSPADIRTTARFKEAPNTTQYNRGFRVVLDINTKNNRG
ncbi:SUMF1/EgtB/PvdO family nonheme iron enzyme [Anaerolineales bacterium HSG6]|nr:SUMF1/EgtB/PvdO family nonheme iron enzyme [Anaerolineales bacterium HSG6]